jgi:hypothetical protein
MKHLMARAAITVPLSLSAVLVIASAAIADPSYDIFDAKDGWICGADEGLVDNHCLNTNANGTTLNIKVFDPDPRGPQESASFDTRADHRPCPHDSGSDDGTWWEFADGLYVCHHSGIQP